MNVKTTFVLPVSFIPEPKQLPLISQFKARENTHTHTKREKMFLVLIYTLSCSQIGVAQLSGMWRYIRIGTYPHRFSHPEPAVAPAMDTDIGPLLSAPRSHTGSWPYRKCERLMDVRVTRHTLTHVGTTGENKGRTVHTALTYSFLTHIDTHTHTSYSANL